MNFNLKVGSWDLEVKVPEKGAGRVYLGRFVSFTDDASAGEAENAITGIFVFDRTRSREILCFYACLILANTFFQQRNMFFGNNDLFYVFHAIILYTIETLKLQYTGKLAPSAFANL